MSAAEQLQRATEQYEHNKRVLQVGGCGATAHALEFMLYVHVHVGVWWPACYCALCMWVYDGVHVIVHAWVCVVCMLFLKNKHVHKRLCCIEGRAKKVGLVIALYGLPSAPTLQHQCNAIFL